MAVSFIIECDKSLDYLEELKEKLNQESSRILNYFKTKLEINNQAVSRR